MWGGAAGVAVDSPVHAPSAPVQELPCALRAQGDWTTQPGGRRGAGWSASGEAARLMSLEASHTGAACCHPIAAAVAPKLLPCGRRMQQIRCRVTALVALLALRIWGWGLALGQLVCAEVIGVRREKPPAHVASVNGTLANYCSRHKNRECAPPAFPWRSNNNTIETSGSSPGGAACLRTSGSSHNECCDAHGRGAGAACGRLGARLREDQAHRRGHLRRGVQGARQAQRRDRRAQEAAHGPRARW